MSETGNDNGSDKHRASKERSLANLRPYKPGQSGNPKGRPVGAFNDVLRAYAAEKPSDGDPRTRFERLVEAVWQRALGGSSRHAQLILDRLVPHKSIRVNDNTRTVQVLMQIAREPEGWQRPVLDAGGEGEGHLLTDKDASDGEETE